MFFCCRSQAAAEEKTSSLPIIESGSRSEPSPSTSRHSSTASDLELNVETVGRKKMKRKPKKTYQALAEEDSTEYETDDEGPRKVQKIDQYKSKPDQEDWFAKETAKIENQIGMSTSRDLEAYDPLTFKNSPQIIMNRSKDKSPSKKKKGKPFIPNFADKKALLKYYERQWGPDFMENSNKHANLAFNSKIQWSSTEKKFVKGEDKNIISDNKNCNIENNGSIIALKTKCSLCEGKREKHHTKCKHLINDNSDSNNTENYNAESQLNYSTGEGQVDIQQNHFEPKSENVIQFEMHFELGLPEAQIDPEQDHSKFQKTPLSYTQMAVIAILSTEYQKMSAYEIYSFIKENFHLYKANPSKSWKSSLRHTLSGHKFFEDTGEVYNNEKQGRNGSYWILSTSKTSEIKRQMKQCWNKNKEIILASTFDPERIAKFFKECDALETIQESP